MANASLLQQYPQLASDPEFMRLYQQALGMSTDSGRRIGGSNVVDQRLAVLKQATDRAHALGIMPADRRVGLDGNDESVHATRNTVLKTIATDAALFAAPYALGALAGGAGSSAAAPTITTAEGTVLPASTLPAALPAGAAASGAAPAAGSFLGLSPKSWAAVISSAGSLAKTYLGNRAENKAADEQTKANAQAQEQQRQYQAEMRNRITQTQEAQRQLYSPYTSLGAGAAQTLASRMGLPSMPQGAPGMQPGLAGPTTYSPNTQLTPVDPGNAQGLVTNPQGPPLSAPVDPKTAGTLASLGSGALQEQASRNTASSYPGAGLVTMRSPDGEIGQVPAHQVAFYQSKGAQAVT